MVAAASNTAPDLLKLLAFDEEDLGVLSAAFQDAIVRVADMAYLPRERRFAFAAARFDWVGAARGRRERCWAGMHFDCVHAVAQIGISQAAPEAILNLLAIRFTAVDPPAGAIVLTFSGNASVRLEVECIDAHMRDLGPRWRTRALPGHAIDESPEDEAALAAVRRASGAVDTGKAD
jgi:hypothetical protein